MGVGAGVYLYDVVVKKFTIAVSSPDEFLLSVLTTDDKLMLLEHSSLLQPWKAERLVMQ